MDKQKIERFIEAWGEMGALWGLNTSLARVHAYLITSDDPRSLDQISKTLSISRGNASMCLKDLRAWGVVRRVKLPGDRRDYYASEHDVWKMLFAFARERKRREFDPLLSIIREALAEGPENPQSPVEQRLAEMEKLMGAIDRMMQQLLADETNARAVLAFLGGKPSNLKG